MLMLLSHARSAKDRRLAHVVPPVERDAGDVEPKEDLKREIGPTGCANGGAEPARDEVAAAGADCADEAERGRGFERRLFERERAASLALALGFVKLLRAEDRGDRHIGRAIADAGQSEKSQKHGEEAGKLLLIHEVDHAQHRKAHRDENKERHFRTAALSREPTTEWTRNRANQRAEKGNSYRDLGE